MGETLRYSYRYIEIDREKEENCFVGRIKINMVYDETDTQWDQCPS
jgi:hypothetical protein